MGDLKLEVCDKFGSDHAEVLLELLLNLGFVCDGYEFSPYPGQAITIKNVRAAGEDQAAKLRPWLHQPGAVVGIKRVGD